MFSRPWPGYGQQKNYGLRQARYAWVLFIDADEEVTPSLKKEILAITQKPYKDFYWLRIVTVFLGRPLKHLYGHNLRLFKKDTGEWTSSRVHEQVKRHSKNTIIQLGNSDSATLKSPLLHHSHPTINSYLNKMHHYTTLDAEQMCKTKRHRSGQPVKPSFFLPFYLATKQFTKLYFYRRGFLDGYAGFVWCLLSSYYEFEMAKKHLALCA